MKPKQGLKIIQSYFHGQVKPDDPLDFPPLGHPTNSEQAAACPTPASNPTWNLASQMKKMVCFIIKIYLAV